MALSNNALNLLDKLKTKFQGRPTNLKEFQNLENYSEEVFNELKEHEIIKVIIKDDFPIIWVTPKGEDFDIEQEKEKLKITEEIKHIQQKLSELESEEICHNYEEYKPEYEEYINLLHEYNEIKDAGQILMGRLAELEGTTTKSIYSEYHMDFED